MKKRNKRTIWLLASTAAVVLTTLGFVTCTGGKEVYLSTREAATGKVEVTVMATGYVQPVDKVDVGTQVSGIVEKIYVDFNSQVKKGDLLAELDKSTLREKVSQANASVASSQSDLTYAQQNYDRIKRLYDVKAATEVSYEEAVNRLMQAKTALINSQANLHQAQVNLGYADITSPIDGVVMNREVDQGQTVASSFNTPTLFTIANDLKKMQVEADVDEADIGKVKLGQSVVFTVDSYSNDVFTGTVQQIRLQPTVTSNVVTYTVIIEAPNPEEKLYPGMTANITITVQSEEGIVVPMEALAYQMSTDIQKQLNARSSAAEPGKRRVWVKQGEVVEERQIQTGAMDGVNVVVESGISAGEEIILSASLEKKKANNGNAAANPLMPSRPNRR